MTSQQPATCSMVLIPIGDSLKDERKRLIGIEALFVKRGLFYFKESRDVQ